MNADNQPTVVVKTTLDANATRQRSGNFDSPTRPPTCRIPTPRVELSA
jgi:hypothetical protein